MVPTPGSRRVNAWPRHPLAIRLSHWLGALMLGVMVWSGMLIYWAYSPYHITVAGVTLVQFFPKEFFAALGLERQLGKGMAWHLSGAWAFGAASLAYITYALATGHYRWLRPGGLKGVRQALDVTLHDLYLRRRPPAHDPLGAKYNAAQRIAYLSVSMMGFLVVLSGVAIYRPVQLGPLVWLLGGYEVARLIHFASTLGLVGFVVVHLMQVARAGLSNLIDMIDGGPPLPDETATGAEPDPIAPPAAPSPDAPPLPHYGPRD